MQGGGGVDIGNGLPVHKGNFGDFYVDTSTGDLYVYMDDVWQRPIHRDDLSEEVEVEVVSSYSDKDIGFLRALKDDPQRVPMYTKRGELTDDHGRVLMRLERESNSRNQRAWQLMHNKISGLFCMTCDKFGAADGLCDVCRTRLRDSMVRIQRATR